MTTTDDFDIRPASASSSAMTSYCAAIKDEADSNDSSQSSSRDPENDAQRLERKRERNRMAARKCRLRKLEQIDRLEADVENLRKVN